MSRSSRLLLPLALLAGACGRGAREPAGDRLDLLAPGALVAVEGEARLGREARLTSWYGRESAEGAPELLGDERPALRVSTPSRLRAALPAGAPRRLTLAARRVRPEPAGTPALRAEAFWEPEGGPPRSLRAEEFAADDDGWREWGIDLPEEAGTLWLVARAAHPGLAAQSAGSLCWGAPCVAPSRPPPLPDLILVTVDTLRVDALDAMPRTRALFDGGLWAPRAVAPSNWTLPSFASLWTGLPADQHGAGRGDFAAEPAPGAEARRFSPLGPSPDFPSALRAAGWAAAGFHQNPFLEDWTGLSRGFDRWVRLRDEPAALREPALAWWRAHAHRPRLLLLHWMTPHLPYGEEDEGDPLRARDWRAFLAGDHAPEERATFFALSETERAEVRRRYRAEAARLDAEIAGLVEALRAEGRDPALLFWSDHGEELWDEGSFEHGHSFAEALVRVPLALRWPGRVPPRTLEGAVPAGQLGLHLLHVLGGADAGAAAALRRAAAGLPPCGLTPECPAGGRGAECTSPLYRAAHGGARYPAGGGRELLPFLGRGSGGAPAALDAETLSRLAELGYSGR